MALENYDQADFAFKQAVDLGNYELDTWLKWAEVVRINGETEAAVQILSQGREFYPESLKLLYRSVGYLLLANDPINARIMLMDALKIDIKQKKLHLFTENFPQYGKI